ncbi:MAG: ribosome maturation factor RimP [Acidobacteriota bacterium]
MAGPWLDRLRALAEESAAAHGLLLFDVESRATGRRWWIRVTLDRLEGPVTLEDCEKVSRRLSLSLDAEDVVPHAYELEVSSPGVERPLRTPGDFERFRGRKVHLVLAPGGGEPGGTLEGLSEGCEEEAVLVKVGEEVRRIPLSRIKGARLVFEFP